MNVFEHQRFLLRTRPPEGGPGDQLRLSWKEIMTGPDQALRFDYPLEYMNVAALGLCAALTQAVFDPADAEELVGRLMTPLIEDEIEKAIAPLRDAFAIDGKRPFLQGPEPKRDAKGRLDTGSLSEILLTVKKGDKEFLNRPIDEWGVAIDQIPLLLFSRSTFFEKSAGRGYLTGTSGDLEIRTFPIDRGSLRRTIWLNVLTRENQTKDFIAAGAGSDKDYDSWMWLSPPKGGEVAQGRISLRSGLFWMVANGWIDIRELDSERLCIVTGEPIPAGERAGTGVVVTATSIGFGAKVPNAQGVDVRQSFFEHPNGPYKVITPEKTGIPFTTHLSVEENRGLIGQMGGLFFATGRARKTEAIHIAPIVKQLTDLQGVLEDDHDVEGRDRYDLLCFGFNMLSSKKNVHGGYASELFTYPILGRNLEDREVALDAAEAIVNGAAQITRSIEYALHRAIQRCTMTATDSEDNDGVVTFKEKEKINSSGMMNDATAELWSNAGDELRLLLIEIDKLKESSDEIRRNEQTLLDRWTDAMVRHAERIFHRYFNTYSVSPQHLLAAHDARRLFYSLIRNIDSGVFERRSTSIPTSSTEVEQNG